MTNSTPYDYIIAGAGAAGLSLAWLLTHSPQLRQKRILLIDRDAKEANDRTWGYWAKSPEPFDAHTSWQFVEAEFISRYHTQTFSLAPYQYWVLEGKKFYETVKARLAHFPEIHWLQAAVTGFEDTRQGARVHTNKGSYEASWVFNSCFLPEALQKAAKNSLSLRQHFKGWVIETKEPAFDAMRLRLFDFRTPQLGSLRFFYLIPHHPQRALVEYTLFSGNLLSPEAYEQALEHYIREVLQLKSYRIVDEEWGVIPMTSYQFPQKQGSNVVNIGSVGGASKASTGYTFRRLQQQCRQIVQQLEKGQEPLPKTTSLRHRLYDATLLNILDKKGAQGEAVFARLFQKNPLPRLLSFLDEETHLLQELQLMQTVDKPLFMGSMLQMAIRLPKP